MEVFLRYTPMVDQYLLLGIQRIGIPPLPDTDLTFTERSKMH
jgi:hypothetical protein